MFPEALRYPGSNPRQALLEGCGVHSPNNEGLFFTTQNRVITLAPQGKESDRGQGKLILAGMVALGVGWAQGSWEWPSGDICVDTPGRPLLSRD